VFTSRFYEKAVQPAGYFVLGPEKVPVELECPQCNEKHMFKVKHHFVCAEHTMP